MQLSFYKKLNQKQLLKKAAPKYSTKIKNNYVKTIESNG